MTKTTKELNDYEVTSDSEYDLESKWYSEKEVEEIKQQTISEVLEIIEFFENNSEFKAPKELIKQIEEK